MTSQLDIFEDSDDVGLRNAVVDALDQRDAKAARDSIHYLAHAHPDDPLLPSARVLLDALLPIITSLRSHTELGHRVENLETRIVPAAQRVFDHGAEAWLRPCWRTLAHQAHHLGWVKHRPSLHAAPLWLTAGDWGQTRESVSGIDSWRRKPLPLAWMAEAWYRLRGIDDTWPLLVELAWLSPQRFETLLKILRDPCLDALRKRFDIDFDGNGTNDDLAWFPAWVLTDQAALARHVAAAQPSGSRPPEQGMRVMLELLSLERQGRRDEVYERRKLLNSLHPGLFAAYIRHR